MIVSYLFYLIGILMLNRKVYLFMTPVLISICWRFGSVTSLRNFTVDEMLVMVSVVKIAEYMIIRKFEYRMPLLRWHLIYLLGVVFTFMIGLLLFQSYDQSSFNDTLLVYVKERLYLPVVFAAVFVQVRDTEEGLSLLRWSAIIGIPLSIYSIIQYHLYILPGAGTFGSFWLYSWFDENEFDRIFAYGRAFGTEGHPATLGRYMMFVVVLGLVQGIHGLEGRRPWWPGLVVAILAFYALGASGSRGPMIGLVVGIVTITYLERKSFSRNLIIIIIAVMAFSYAVPQIMTERMGAAVEEGANEMNVSSRFIMWSDATNDVMTANPFTGYGYKYGFAYDNDFVSIFYEGGFVLLILFGFWLLSIYQLGRVGMLSGSRLSQLCGVIIIGSLVSMIGAALSGRSFFSCKVGLEFIYILAICGRTIMLRGREQRQLWARQLRTEAALP